MSVGEDAIRRPEFLQLSKEAQIEVIGKAYPTMSLPAREEFLMKRMQYAAPRANLAPQSAFQPGIGGPPQVDISPQAMQPPQPGEEQRLRGMFRPGQEDWRNAAIVGGMSLGSAAMAPFTGGMSALPTLAMMATGAAGGAAVGSLASDVAGLDRSESLGQGIRRAGEEAAYAPFFEYGGAAVGAAGGMARRFAAKAQPELIALGERYGVRLGIEDVSLRSALQKTRNVFGKFPLISKPYKEASERKAGDLMIASKELFDEVAPLLSETAVGRNANHVARNEFKWFRDEVGKRFDNFRALAASTNSRIPTNVTKFRAAEYLDEVGGTVPQVIKKGKKQRIKLEEDKPADIARELVKLTDNMSVGQWRRLERDMYRKIGKLKTAGRNDEAGAILTFVDAMKTDRNAIVGPPQVVEALKDANRFMHEGLSTVFETPTAQKFARVDKNLFRFGYEEQGSKNADELLSVVMSKRSPDAVRDLRRLMTRTPEGRETFNAAVRVRLEKGFDGALREGITEDGRVLLKRTALSNEFGLFRPKSPERETLVEALDGTGVSAESLERFVDLAYLVSKSEVIDVSTFVARRGMLGGFKSIVRSVTPGAQSKNDTMWQTVKSAGGALTVILGSRRFGHWLTDPVALRNITKAINPASTETVRRAAIMRLSRMIPDDPEGRFAGIMSGSMARTGARAVPLSIPRPIKSRGPMGLLALGELLEGGVRSGLKSLPGETK